MAFEDIEKLKEKVAKDPNSKLFVPLADEYRKAGMLDDAISVLVTGLESQPNYMSARVALGKIYLEKQMTKEARDEFEKVVTAIPDNLFAQKKLAEIYRDGGETAKAIEQYKKVLKLNPIDEESVANIEALQKQSIVKETVVKEEPLEEKPAPVKNEFTEEIIDEEEIEVLPAEKAPKEDSSDDFEKFRAAMNGKTEGLGEVIGEEIIAGDEMKEAEILANDDMFKAPEAERPKPLEEQPVDRLEYLKELTSVQEKNTPVKEVPAEKSPVEKTPTEKIFPEKISSEKKPLPKLTDAEALIASGEYSKAIKIYKELLTAEPDNRLIRQKIEELNMLLKLLGKQGEGTISNLEAFAEALKKRKDEFFRNS